MKIPVEKILPSQKLREAIGDFRFRSYYEFKATPTLADQGFLTHIEALKEVVTKDDGLLIDFTSWQESFHLALTSGLDPDQIYVVDGAKYGGVYLDEIKRVLNHHEQGYILLVCKSKFSESYTTTNNILTLKELPNRHLELELINMGHKAKLYHYQITADTIGDPSKAVQCPKNHTKEYYMEELYRNQNWLKEAEREAREKGITVEEAVEIDAQWMVDHHDTTKQSQTP